MPSVITSAIISAVPYARSPSRQSGLRQAGGDASSKAGSWSCRPRWPRWFARPAAARGCVAGSRVRHRLNDNGMDYIMRTQSLVTAVLIAAVALTISGCMPAPVTAKAASAVTGISGGLPDGYWSRPVGTAAKRPTGVRRIAVTEFSVEFVAVRSRMPFASQPFFKPPPVGPPPGGFVSAGVEIAGVFRAVTPISAFDRRSLTAALYDEFLTNLRASGYEVVPAAALHGRAAYALLTANRADGAVNSSSPLRYLSLFSDDVGVINATTTVPAPGTRLVNDHQSDADRRQFSGRLLAEVGADAAVAVRLRVGSCADRAAIERGSSVSVIYQDGRETFCTSKRSLLSDDTVGAPSHFELVTGDIEPVRQPAFTAAVKGLFVPYLAPALERTLGHVPTAAVEHSGTAAVVGVGPYE